jgi:hypothetical protein
MEIKENPEGVIKEILDMIEGRLRETIANPIPEENIDDLLVVLRDAILGIIYKNKDCLIEHILITIKERLQRILERAITTQEKDLIFEIRIYLSKLPVIELLDRQRYVEISIEYLINIIALYKYNKIEDVIKRVQHIIEIIKPGQDYYNTVKLICPNCENPGLNLMLGIDALINNGDTDTNKAATCLITCNCDTCHQWMAGIQALYFLDNNNPNLRTNIAKYNLEDELDRIGFKGYEIKYHKK